MQLKTVLITTALIFLGYSAFAQSHKVTTAWNHLQHDEFKEAYEAIEEAIEHPRTEDDAQAWYYRGVILMSLANTEDYQDLHADPVQTQLDAFESLEKANELDRRGRYEREIAESLENLTLNFFNIGVEFYNEEQYDRASEFFENYLRGLEILGADKDQDGIFYAGYAAYMNDDLDLAEERLSTLADHGYDDETIYVLLSEMYLDHREDTTTAIEVIEQGREEFPGSEQLTLTKIDIFLQQDRVEEVVNDLEQAVEEHPENYDLKFVLGTAYDEVGEEEKAIEMYKEVADAREDEFDANYNLGAMLFNKGAQINNKALDVEDDEKADELQEEAREYFKDAKPYLEKAHELDNEHRHTMISLRAVYFQLNEGDKGRQIDNRLEQVHGEGLEDDEIGGEGEIEE